MHRLAIAMFCVVLVASSASAGGEPAAGSDKWAPVRPLLGEWAGDGTGLGGRSTTTHSYAFAIQEQFIQSRTSSRFEPSSEDGEAEIHEDWGFFSYDPDLSTLVLRQFLSEGYVNTYILESPETHDESHERLVFTTTSTEGAGGLRARLTIQFLGPDAYNMVLELAQPGEEWFSCRNLEMRRVR